MISLQPALKKYAFILVAIIGILAYANSFNNDFQFDDGYHIVDGTKIKNLDKMLTAEHWKDIGNRPLAFFTLAVNYEMNELELPGYHVVNLLFHILAGFVTFLLIMEILSLSMFRKNKIVSEYKVLIALFAAFIFVAHPIQTQAVTYIIQRMSVMAGFFYIWSVLLYVRGRKAHLSKKTEKKWIPYTFYAGAFLVGFLGFLSKQNAITFPLAFILVEIMFIRREQQKIDRKFLTVFASIVGVIIVLGLSIKGLPAEYDKISRADYLITQFRVIVKYWQLLFLPVNQHLDYYFVVSDSLWGAKELASLGVILLTMAFGVWLYIKKWKIAAFGIFWFYLTLSLTSSIIPIRDVIFEHRLYMAVLGFGFAISYLAFYFLSARKAIYPVIALSLLTIVYIGASLNRNSVWKTPYTLWTDSVKKSPKRERAWYWLATYYMGEKDSENALKCYDTSIQCNPFFPLAYNGRANLKKENNDLAGAIEDYNFAIKYDPQYVTAYYNRGTTYSAMKKLKQAIADYNKSISFGNKSPAIYYNRGNAKRRNKDYAGAIEDYNRSIKLDPRYPLSYFNRGLTKAAMKKHQEALKDMDIAIERDPNNHLFYNGKGVSLIAMKKFDEAIRNFDRSVQINPKFGQAFYNRGYAKQMGLKDKAGACMDWKMAAAKGYNGANYYLQLYCK